MQPHHTVVGWVLGLVVVSLGLGSLVAWFTWKRLHAFFESTVADKGWEFDPKDREKIPKYPVLIGLLERLFFTILVAFQLGGVASALVLWMGVKMTSGWNRLRKDGAAYRMLAFTGLMCSVVSLITAVLGGLVANGTIPLYRLWE